MNVIAFVYSVFEACDAACYMAKESYMMNCGFHDLFVFSMDQVSVPLKRLAICVIKHIDEF